MSRDLPALRRVRDDEWLAFGRAMGTNFHEVATDAELEAWRRALDLDRYVTATDDEGRHVASGGAIGFELAVPGGARVGCAGVTAITVRTDHRRRGMLRAMIDWLHADARERGEPVAALYASEAPIYGRFGYGVAVPQQDVRIDPRFLTTPDGDAARVQQVSRDRYLEVAPKVQAGVGDRRGGVLTLSDEWWALRTSDVGPDDKPPQQFAVVGGAGAVRGIVRYRVKEGKWADRVADDRLEIFDLMGVDREAEADLWAHVASVDLVTDVVAKRRPPDDPLRWGLVDEARLRAKPSWPMYVALLDVPAALTARTFDTDRVVLEVGGPGDEVARWSLDAGPDGSEVTATDDPADVKLGAPDLASLWLGGVSPFALADARRLVPTDEDVLSRLRRLFAVNRLPWCPMMF